MSDVPWRTGGKGVLPDSMRRGMAMGRPGASYQPAGHPVWLELKQEEP